MTCYPSAAVRLAYRGTLRDFGVAWNLWQEDVDEADLLALARNTGPLDALVVGSSEAGGGRGGPVEARSGRHDHRVQMGAATSRSPSA